MFGLVFPKDILCCFHPFSSFVMFGFDNTMESFYSDAFCLSSVFLRFHLLEKPRAFDPRGQATVTPRGKI